MTDAKGATPEEWFHFDFILGLGANLLPCVPAGPDVKVLKGSQLEGKVGKIPSQFNRNGEAHGLKEWSKRPILSNEVAIWSQDPRLNICVRTGPSSNVYAFDIDIDDARAHDVEAIIDELAPGLPIRERENSCKMLLAFKLEDSSCKKRKIRLDANPKGPAIELLADGQQFVAAGLHSSGVRYQWRGGLPTDLPVLKLATLNQIWQRLTSRFAMVSPSTPNTESTSTSASPTSTLTQGEVLSEISEQDWLTLRVALKFMLDKVTDNDTWSEVGYALLSLQRTRPIEQLWLEFSQKAVGYEAGAPEAWWSAHAQQTPRSDYRHIFTIARSQGWGRTGDPGVFTPVRQGGAGSEVHSGAAGTVQGDSDVGGDDASGSVGPDSQDSGLDVAPPPLPEVPVVRLVEANFSEIVHQLETIIEPYVYTQGALLVRPTEGHEVEAVRRESDSLMLVEATKSWAKFRLGELATFERYQKGAWALTAPSAEHINTLLELGSWTTLRPLDAIARAPFVREDGSICDTPGYDSRSRTLFVQSTVFPGIPTNPSRPDADRALGRLRGVFDQFPWKEPASESAFLSHILTEAARLAIIRAPMFWYSAPNSGIGKTTLAKMASIIVHGSAPALRPWIGNSEELRKTLFASLLAGDRSIAFDNVPTGVKARAPELCAFITADVWKDRKLGVSEAHAVANKAVVSASGNNVTPVSDLARRSVVVRLDANTEQLKERRFRIASPENYVMEHRPELLVAVLTIIKAYLNAPAVEMPVPFPSFEQWSRMAREPLIWLGMPDPCLTQNETDDEIGSVGDVFEQLIKCFGEREFTCVDIAHLAGSITDLDGVISSTMLQGGCSEPNSPTKVGYWLRGERDKVSKGWKLVNMGHSMRGAKWKFVKVNGDLT